MALPSCVRGQRCQGKLWEDRGSATAGTGAAPGLGSQRESPPRALPVSSALPDHSACSGNIHFLPRSLMIPGKSGAFWSHSVACDSPSTSPIPAPNPIPVAVGAVFPSPCAPGMTGIHTGISNSPCGCSGTEQGHSPCPWNPRWRSFILGAAQGLCGFHGEPDVAAQ